MDILGEIKTVKARKDHRCTASEVLFESFGHWESEILDLLNDDEFKVYKEFVKNGCLIKKGEEYIRYALVDNGDFWSCKEYPIIRKLCVELDLWDNY